MISDGRQFLFDAWWIATFPGFVTFALIGEGLEGPRSGVPHDHGR